jgi:hypothetical protein
MRGDKHIVAADRSALPFEIASKGCVSGIGWRLKGRNLEGLQGFIDARLQTQRRSFRDPKSQLSRHNHACEHGLPANCANALGDTPLGIADEVCDDVCIKQKSH